MKKSSVLILVLIAVTIGVIVSSMGDFSTYETFASATQKEGKTIHVVGYLDASEDMEYDPIKDPNRFTFYAKDKDSAVSKVVFSGTKPTDFERAEQLVMTGSMQNGAFHCDKIQMKCPSKYENDQIAVGNTPGQY